MSCAAGSKRLLLEGEPIDAITCVFSTSMGEPVFATLFLFPIAVAMYFLSDSVAVPGAVVIIGGVVFMSKLPAFAVNATMFALVVGLAVVAFLGMMRLRRE